jgi:hypothetical protein
MRRFSVRILIKVVPKSDHSFMPKPLRASAYIPRMDFYTLNCVAVMPGLQVRMCSWSNSRVQDPKNIEFLGGLYAPRPCFQRTWLRFCLVLANRTEYRN